MSLLAGPTSSLPMLVTHQVCDIAHMQEIHHPGTLPVTVGTYIAYKIMLFVFDHACSDLWSTKISNQICFLDISLIFQIFVKHWLYIKVAFTNMS